MPWKILAAPLVLAVAFLIFLATGDKSYSIYIVPLIFALVILYIFSPQINWWWYRAHPPALAKGLVSFFEKKNPIYQRMPENVKKHYRDRVSLFMIALDFIPDKMESVALDIKAITAASAAQMTMGKSDFLFPKFEHVIITPAAFPSPQYPKQFHPSEIYEKDGVVMFSAQHLIKGFAESNQYYHIGLHEYAKVFIHANPNEAWPTFEEDIWDELYRVSNFKKEAIFKYINLDDITPLPVSICHFFVFPDKFQQVFPELYRKYTAIFNQIP